MTSLKTLAAAALLAALTATPVFAHAAIQEPGLFASYHSNSHVLGRPESRNIGQTLTNSHPRIASHSASPGWKGADTRNDDWPANMILG
jgi:hypothetical protein